MLMREYELVYVIQPDAADERENEIHAKIDEVIAASAGAEVLVRDDWGKRKLAYEIDKFQKGHYFQLNYLAQGTEISEIERRLRIDSDILRFLTVQVSDAVRDVEARRKEAAEQAAEQARRREEREREREERERREAESSTMAAEHDSHPSIVVDGADVENPED
jgi:small subunit ribosomal protein S6